MNVSWSLLFWLWSILTESNNVNIISGPRYVSLSITLPEKSSRHLSRYRIESTVMKDLRRSYFHLEIIIELSSLRVSELQDVNARVMMLILLLLSIITTRVPINTSVVHRALLWETTTNYLLSIHFILGANMKHIFDPRKTLYDHIFSSYELRQETDSRIEKS